MAESRSLTPFSVVPTAWMTEKKITMADLGRLMMLQQRYTFFIQCHVASGESYDIERVFWESQERLAELLGFSIRSRSKVSEFLARMEEVGYIKQIRTKQFINGKTKAKNYIVVNNPHIFEQFKGVNNEQDTE